VQVTLSFSFFELARSDPREHESLALSLSLLVVLSMHVSLSTSQERYREGKLQVALLKPSPLRPALLAAALRLALPTLAPLRAHLLALVTATPSCLAPVAVARLVVELLIVRVDEDRLALALALALAAAPARLALGRLERRRLDETDGADIEVDLGLARLELLDVVVLDQVVLVVDVARLLLALAARLGLGLARALRLVDLVLALALALGGARARLGLARDLLLGRGEPRRLDLLGALGLARVRVGLELGECEAVLLRRRRQELVLRAGERCEEGVRGSARWS